MRTGWVGLAVLLAGCGSVTDPNAPAWRRVTAPGPGPRWGHAAVYDPAGDRMLIFAGQTPNGERNDVWSFDLASETWTSVPTTHAPAPRVSPAVVLDRTRNRLVALSGRSGTTTYFPETWSLNLGSMAWTSLDSAPDGRERAHVATNGLKAWFHGGEHFLGVFADLWEFDLASNGWTHLPGDDDANGPGGRTCGAMMFTADGLVLTGGHDDFVKPGTFHYDFAEKQWSTVTMTGTTAAAAHWAYATDPACQSMVLMGGDHKDNYDTSLTDWLDPSARAFSRLPTSNLPPVRDHATVVVDEKRHQLVLFGGTLGDGQGFLDDTWIYPLTRCP